MFTCNKTKTIFIAMFVVLVPSKTDEVYAQFLGEIISTANSDGEITDIEFDGEPEWLVSQKDPRSHFHKFRKLSSLYLNRHHVSVSEIEYITTLKSLRTLKIGEVKRNLSSEVHIDAKTLSKVQSMDWLESLEVHAEGLSDGDWAFLKSLKHLKHLKIRDGENDALTDEVFKNFVKLNSLKSISIRGNFTVKAIQTLTELQSLEEIEIDSPYLTDESVKWIAKLPHLEKLSLNASISSSDSQLTDKGVEYLKNISSLRVFKIGGSISSKAIQYLSESNDLEELTMNDVQRISKKEMNRIAKFQKLRELYLENAQIGDTEIAAFKNHPTLRILILPKAKVTSSSLSIFHSIKGLKHLALYSDIESQKVEDAFR